MNGLIPIVAILFFVPSVVYGKIAGTVKNEKEVAAHMGKAMSSMGGYLCLAFVASQFISYFNYTNLGTIIAVSGAEIFTICKHWCYTTSYRIYINNSIYKLIYGIGFS